MDKQDLMNLPGSITERQWLEERLETLSVRESYALAAVIARHPPEQMRDAVNCLLTLDDCEVCFPAGDYEQLGQLSLCTQLPEDILQYVDFAWLGQKYQAEHPGLFVGESYVICPDKDTPQYDGHTPPEDKNWSVKLKLASPAVPEGVWVRLPDHSGVEQSQSTEITLALNALQAGSLADCTLLEARCILPGIGNLTEQYDNIEELIRDGTNLGIVLGGHGLGRFYSVERFLAALEYETCRSLRLALDISQNLHCYQWVPCWELAEFGAKSLELRGIPEDLINSGCIDLEHYAINMYEKNGYMLTSGETGYVKRNKWTFHHMLSAPSEVASTLQEGGPALG